MKPAFLYHHGHVQLLSVRIRPEGVQETMAFLQATWEKLAPGRPFEYRFLDDD